MLPSIPPSLPNSEVRVPRLPSDSPILKQILRDLYGLEGAKASLQNGYDDLNFRVEEEEGGQEGGKSQCWTLKFSNLWEGQKYPKLCDGQIELATLLARNGIECPQIVPQKDGSRHALVQLGGATVPVRLFTFVPGQTLEEWLLADKSHRQNGPILGELARKVGRLLGRFHTILDKNAFCPSAFHEFFPPMSLEGWPSLRREFELQAEQMAHFLEGPRAQQCRTILAQFQQEVLDKRAKFQRGLIHSDFNESNILLVPHSPLPEICGLLDFGDCHFSYRMADLANAILYLYLLLREQSLEDPNGKLLETTAFGIFSGFSSSASLALPPFDLSHLRLFLKARLLCSLLNGLKTLRIESERGIARDMAMDIDMDMDYVLRTQKKGWTVLEELGSAEGNIL